MRFTDRVRSIVDMNTTEFFIPLIVKDASGKIYPMYYVQLIGDHTLAFPVTNATEIGVALKEPADASAIVSDRAGGYEAYLLEGKACYKDESDDKNLRLVAEMRNIIPGFPIHGAVVFEVTNVHMTPPP